MSTFFNTIRRLVESSSWASRLIYNASNRKEFSSLIQHEKMLADKVRVNTYAAGISRIVAPGSVAVDLGTGTGILAHLAARQGATVYAIDHSDFIDVARHVAEKNRVAGIEFLKINSRDFSPKQRVDYIIHEQMGDDLFNENMMENILDLKRRVLKPGGRILPGKFSLFLEPVAIRECHQVPFIWEKRVQGVDFSFLRDSEIADDYRGKGYSRYQVTEATLDHFLCDPVPVLTFDLNEMSSPSELPTQLSIDRRVVKPGSMDGLCLYFSAAFDDKTGFDTKPGQTHWPNRLFRTPARSFGAGDTIRYRVDLTDIRRSYTWKFAYE